MIGMNEKTPEEMFKEQITTEDLSKFELENLEVYVWCGWYL